MLFPVHILALINSLWLETCGIISQHLLKAQTLVLKSSLREERRRYGLQNSNKELIFKKTPTDAYFQHSHIFHSDGEENRGVHRIEDNIADSSMLMLRLFSSFWKSRILLLTLISVHLTFVFVDNFQSSQLMCKAPAIRDFQALCTDSLPASLLYQVSLSRLS